MTKPRAIAGVDLHLDLVSTRLRASIEQSLREAVRSGRLAPGTRLPPSRTLAADLQVARNTVAEAYGQLVAEGWLTARQGSGTRVAEGTAGPAAEGSATGPPVTPVKRYDLGAGAPDVTAFPRTAWLAAARHAVSDAEPDVFGYGDPRGLLGLREALAGYLARVRGVQADPERIVVCSGFTQALDLLAQVLLDRGTPTIAVESHGHRLHREVLTRRGLGCTSITVDGHGAATEQLFRTEAGAAVLTPAHQFPLGAVLAPGRRSRAVTWARDRDAYLVEDDYDGEFRYDRQPVGAMQSLAPDRVVYAGTASKTLAPGLRLGWLVVPHELIEEVVAAKTHADGQAGTIDQLTLARFITSGDYDRQVRRSRLVYRRRRDRLVATLRTELPGTQVVGAAAGLHALLPLPGRVTEQEVIAEAARRGLVVQGLDEYAIDVGERPPALVVGYARPPEHAFTGALARLVATLRATGVGRP